MTLRTLEPLFLHTTDESPAGGGTPPAGGTEPGADTKPPTEIETLKAQHERDLDRYRNEIGNERKKAKDLETRLQALEDEKKSDTEKLSEKAGKADTLAQQLETATSELDRYKSALSALLKDEQKALGDYAELVPDGLDEVAQLEWIRKARKTLVKTNGLPPSGDRRPGHQKPSTEPTDEERQRAAQHYASRF